MSSNESESEKTPLSTARQRIQSLRENPYVKYLFSEYHIPFLAVIFTFMIAVRMQSWRRFITPDGVFFSGNDAWYHFRQVSYTVKNWPFTMPFDPMTGYPTGTVQGQFGTLFDQILATVALLVGLGSPSEELIRTVLAISPVVFGGLTLIPVYLLTKKLHSKQAGLLAGVTLALIPGVFLSRSLVGVGDHNIAEPFFMTLAVVAIVYAFTRATSSMVVYEVLLEKDFKTLKDSLGWSIIAGVAVSTYLLVWPPGVFLVGIMGVFFAVYAVSMYLANQTPEPALLSGATIGAVTSVVSLAMMETTAFASTRFSLLQVVLSVGLVAGCFFLIGWARVVEKTTLNRFVVTGFTAAGVVVGTAVLSVATPTLVGVLTENILRVIGFGQHASILTIGEAQPFISNGNAVQVLLIQYGVPAFVAIVGLALLGYKIIGDALNNRDISVELLVLVWSIFVGLAAFTQVRFNYYLAPAVAVLTGYSVAVLFERFSISADIPSLESYQIITIVLVLGLTFTPVLMIPLETSAMSRANHGVGEYQAWDEPLEWVNDNTPEYSSIEPYGTYSETDDYAYENDTYGIMSWWDYGHFTTVTAERTPVANPFQQHAPAAAQFLLAQNESEADAVVDGLSDNDASSSVRYVAVDWKMVEPTSKFGAPVVWHPELNQSDMYDQVYTQSSSGAFQPGPTMMKQRYYESLMVRLYMYHGSSAYPGNVVVDYQNQTAQTADGETVQLKVQPDAQNNSSGAIIKRFNSSQQANQYTQADNSSTLGGIGKYPHEPVDALDHYRLVKTSQASSLESQSYYSQLQQTGQYGDVRVGDFGSNFAWVKIFEKVDGATVNGTGAPPNSSVAASVRLQDPTQNNGTFVYTQFAETDANGNFTMTVPYSTTGYDEVSVEDGGTNLSVTANTKYQFVSLQQRVVVTDQGAQPTYVRWEGQADVTERQVLGMDETPTTVQLEQQPLQPPTNNTTNSTVEPAVGE